MHFVTTISLITKVLSDNSTVIATACTTESVALRNHHLSNHKGAT
jgi:hypothetical protein